MKCKEIEKVILENVTEQAAVPAAVQEHLQHCDNCQKLWRELRQTISLCKMITAPGFSSDFWCQELATFQKTPVAGRRRKLVICLSACFLIVMITTVSFLSWTGVRFPFNPETTSYVQGKSLLPSDDDLFQLADYLKEEDPALTLRLLMSN